MSDRKRVSREQINAPVFCIALSRNDRFVALGFASEVWIYEIENKRIHRHELPPMTDPKLDSQLVCFSADCEKVIVATRNAKGNVYTYVSDCPERTTDLHLPLVIIPTVSFPNFIFLRNIAHRLSEPSTSAMATTSGSLRSFMTTPATYA
jgi:hypothetical protein